MNTALDASRKAVEAIAKAKGYEVVNLPDAEQAIKDFAPYFEAYAAKCAEDSYQAMCTAAEGHEAEFKRAEVAERKNAEAMAVIAELVEAFVYIKHVAGKYTLSLQQGVVENDFGKIKQESEQALTRARTYQNAKPAAAPTGWQPIETAPDIQRVDIWVEDTLSPTKPKYYRITNVIQVAEGLWMLGSGYLRDHIKPIYWMLPPVGPAQNGGA